MGEADFDEFVLRLREAQTWCSPRRFHDGMNLRTPYLRPRHLYSMGWEDATAGDSQRAAEVQWLCVQRRHEIASERRSGRLGGEPDTNGRMLAYQVSSDMAEGATELASQGFLDVVSEPPWDTWTWFSESTGVLLAWVPRRFEEAVTKGIEVSSTAAIWWSDLPNQTVDGWGKL